jgi:hypothetical protein
MSRKRKALIGLGIFIALLVAARIAAPYVIKRVVNDKLAAMPEYWGHIDDVGLSLWRGAYQFNGLIVTKRAAGSEGEPLVAIPATDIMVAWKALFDGKISSRVRLIAPRVNFVAAKTEKATTTKPPTTIAETLHDLVALEINKFEVVNGRLTYLDERETPKVDLHLANVDVTVRDLRTRPGDNAERRPTTGEVTASVQQTGRLKAGFRANMFAPDHPDVDGEIALRRLPLTELTDFARAYAGFDFEAGTMSTYAELAVTGESISGYVKPIISGKKVLDLAGNDEGDNVLEVAWEAFVAGVTSILENRSTDDVATRVSFEGRLDQPNVSVWGAVFSLLGNAFLKAILPGVENRVSLASVGGTVRPYVVDKPSAKMEAEMREDAEKAKAAEKADQRKKRASKDAVEAEKEAMKERAERRR